MADPGFRSWTSLYWLPDGSTFNPLSPVGGFRSFASVWFGPDGGPAEGGGVVVPPAADFTLGKMIHPAECWLQDRLT